jgi:hypothetical protein
MIWEQLSADFCVALLAVTCIVIAVVTAERARAASVPAERKALALLRPGSLPSRPGSTSSESISRSLDPTPARYRIRHGHMINIDQLDSAGNKVCAWCLVPEGELAAGDCMLAQKISLETFETKALAIANRSEGNVWRRLILPPPNCASRGSAVECLWRALTAIELCNDALAAGPQRTVSM